MAQNTKPRFTLVANNRSVAITGANASSDGTGVVGTSMFAVVVPGLDGSYVDNVRFMPSAPAPTAMTPTTARIFRSTIPPVLGAVTSPLDTFLIAAISLPASNADNATAATAPLVIPWQGDIGPGEYLYATNHVAPAATTAWIATGTARDY